MADDSGSARCLFCGKKLPTKQGRGRRRIYCDERCRDRARRRRESSAVLNSLTPSDRREMVDGDDVPLRVRDPEAARVAGAARRLVIELERGSAPDAAVVAAWELSAAAEEALRVAVGRARSAGRSWRDIGEVLGTSRQAAFQKYGHLLNLRAGVPTDREVATGAAERVASFVADFTAERWEQVLEYFNDPMRRRHDTDRLADGWGQLLAMFGRLEGTGDAMPVPAGSSVTVDVPLIFEAGEAMLWVRFDSDSRVSGLRLHPASP